MGPNSRLTKAIGSVLAHQPVIHPELYFGFSTNLTVVHRLIQKLQEDFPHTLKLLNLRVPLKG